MYIVEVSVFGWSGHTNRRSMQMASASIDIWTSLTGVGIVPIQLRQWSRLTAVANEWKLIDRGYCVETANSSEPLDLQRTDTINRLARSRSLSVFHLFFNSVTLDLGYSPLPSFVDSLRSLLCPLPSRNLPFHFPFISFLFFVLFFRSVSSVIITPRFYLPISSIYFLRSCERMLVRKGYNGWSSVKLGYIYMIIYVAYFPAYTVISCTGNNAASTK